MESVLLKTAMDNVPRLLSLMDRTPSSKTYGCFDRFYWHYKKSDIPIASIQNGVYSLALLYKNKFDNNPYYKNEKVYNWIRAGIKYWCGIQNKDGSFNDYYPKERSYIATAIGLYPIAKTISLLGYEIPVKEFISIIPHLDRAARFLMKNKELGVLNQEAIASAALCYVNKILNRAEIEVAYRNKLETIVSLQDEEGWFPEYGGFDVGYLSYMIDALTAIYQETGDPLLEQPIQNAIEFIRYFMHPDYTVGGEYSARDTEFIIPTGFVRAGDWDTYNFIEQSLITKKGFSISHLDYRYLPLYMYSYIESAILEEERTKPINLPYNYLNFEKSFPNAGVFIKKTDDQYIIIGTKKGGVIKIFDIKKKALVFSDCGYVFPIDKNKYFVTAYYEPFRDVSIEPNKITIKGNYCVVKNITPTVLNHIILRVINYLPLVSKPLREIIKYVMITKKNIVKEKFQRTILFGNKIKIKDVLTLKGPSYSTDKLSYRYTPSAKYFVANELNKTEDVVERVMEKDDITI